MSEWLSDFVNPQWLAVGLMLISYFFFFTEKSNRATVAILFGSLMVVTGLLSAEEAFKGIDFNTICLLIGMMLLTATAQKSGMFQYAAIWLSKRVKASPRALLPLIIVLTGFLAAFMNTATTAMLIVPITLVIVEKLKVNPYPFLYGQIFALTTGGNATLIGDAAALMIGNAAGFSFMDFIHNATLAILIIFVLLCLVMDFFCGRHFKSNMKERARVMMFDERDTINDKPLVYKTLFVLFLTIGGFIFSHELHLSTGVIALLGASLLLFLHYFSKHHEEETKEVEEIISSIDWITIYFFVGLFVIVHGVEQTGLFEILAHEFIALTGGNILTTTMAVLWGSAYFSTAIDNIPLVATMISIVHEMEPHLGGPENVAPIWWALTFGACLGGNGTLIASIASLTVAGLAQKNGYRIKFVEFMKWGILYVTGCMLVCTVYLYVKFFALT